MKGFPNQVSDLKTLASALKVMIDLLAEGENSCDDGVFGEALIRRTVLGTGHTPVPVDHYLVEQKRKAKSDQSFRTRARGLRELFRILRLVDDTEDKLVVAGAGSQVAEFAGKEITPDALRLWRTVIVRMFHDGGDGQSSHPYQVLLRLVAKRPGITRAKCALALEAKNDSDNELDRIVALADLEQDEIRCQIGISKPNWDNAKKILPRFAEQLGDVQKIGERLYLSDAPGVPQEAVSEAEVERQARGPRRPKSATAVTSATIAVAGAIEDSDGQDELAEPVFDPEAIKARKAKITARLRRHNQIVRQLAGILENEGAELFENPFDCLACFAAEGLLVEVKSLDGTEKDEVLRVRDALAQLLYYESFVTRPLVQKRAIRKIACFEHKISDDHVEWLQAMDIYVIWRAGDRFDGTTQAKKELVDHLGF